MDLNWEQLAKKISEQFGNTLMGLAEVWEIPEEEVILRMIAVGIDHTA